LNPLHAAAIGEQRLETEMQRVWPIAELTPDVTSVLVIEPRAELVLHHRQEVGIV
jgi:hypothetical protein